MENINKILICGLGAIGSIYAVAISQYNPQMLKVLVDNSRLDKYKNTPLHFNNQEYHFDYITPQEKNYQADLIIIATKNNSIADVIADIKNFVSEKTLIISLLNGLKSEELIAKAYGKEKVIDSYYIGHTSTRNGRKVTHDGVYKTVFGDAQNIKLSSRVQKLKNFFEKVEIPYEIPKDMEYSKWWKFLVNVGYNQASALLNAPYRDFQQHKSINDIAIKLMEEAALVAKAEKIQNTENFIPEILEVIKNMLPETKTSMLQDIEAGRKTEIDAFAGYLVELGQKHNIQTPYNAVAYQLIKAMDSRAK